MLKAMARRSSRLVSGGYYNSDEESDSSSVTNISYRETPVKVFKKKAGTRKSVSRTPSRANSNASSVGTETPITAGQYEAPPPSPLISESDPPMRTLPFLPSSTVTPRPPLTPSPSRTPLHYPSLPPERSLYSGLGCSIRPGLTSGAELKERTQSGVESSGYSSSEGPLLWKTPSNTRNTSKGPSAGYWGKIKGAFSSLMDSVSLMLAALKSKIKHLPSQAASVSGRMKKACALLLLFLIALLCVWLLLPLLTPLVSRMAVTKSQSKPKSSPVLFTSSPPLHQPNSIQPAHVVDPALVSAAVEERIQHLLDPSVVSAAVEEKIQRLLDPAVVSAAVEAKMQRLLDPAVVSAAVEAKMQRLLDPAVVSAAVESKMQRLLDPAVVSAAVETKMQRLLDPAVVSAAVEAKMEKLLDSAVVSGAVEVTMQRLLEEQQLKQELTLSQMKESLQLDLKDLKDLKDLQDLNNLQDLKVQLLVLDSENRQRLQQEVSALSRQMEDHQTESLSASEALRVRIQTLEQQNSKFSQEWSSLQMTPPPAPCPEAGLPPVQQQLTPELQQALEKWFSDRIKDQASFRLTGSCSDCGRPDADKMADFALETQGASVISTRCSETYRIRSACVTLFGFPLWYPSESPRTVIQGSPVLLPGKCWAFHGVQGTLLISLSHPITVSHVTLDHLPRYNSPTGRIDSAPRDLQVYGMREESEEGSLLGTFTYDENGESTQTFKLPISSVVYRLVELRVLSNWGHVDYTCLYRFRVHGQISSW